MNPNKKVINVVLHKPTGAKVPITINKVSSEGIIEDYREHLHNRKGFTLVMLQNRWDKCREEVIELLQQFQVPGHLNHQDVVSLKEGEIPLDVAVIFEEYVYGIEAKTNMTHKKLKPKALKDVEFH